jgi:hypothetical protein
MLQNCFVDYGTWHKSSDVFIMQNPKKKDPAFQVEVPFDPDFFKTLKQASTKTPVEMVTFRYTCMCVALSSISNALFHRRLFCSIIKVEPGQDDRSLTSGAFINVASAAADDDNQAFLVCGFAKHKRPKSKNVSVASHALNGQVYAILVKVGGRLLCRCILECVHSCCRHVHRYKKRTSCPSSGQVGVTPRR